MEDGVFLILIISNENTIDTPGILGKNFCQHILLSFQVQVLHNTHLSNPEKVIWELAGTSLSWL